MSTMKTVRLPGHRNDLEPDLTQAIEDLATLVVADCRLFITIFSAKGQWPPYYIYSHDHSRETGLQAGDERYFALAQLDTALVRRSETAPRSGIHGDAARQHAIKQLETLVTGLVKAGEITCFCVIVPRCSQEEIYCAIGGVQIPSEVVRKDALSQTEFGRKYMPMRPD